MTEATLVLVCKRPAPGIGKQRLAAKLGITAAQQIAEALLACALEDALAWPGSIVIAPADATDDAWAATLLPELQSSIKIHPQAAGNLGQRLNSLDCELRASGLNHLVYIGSDAPALSEADFAATREALLNNDTVLKPTTDGGVSIMASRQPWPVLADLPWSTDRLAAALAYSCHQAGHSVATLAHGFDVDEPEDLSRVITALVDDQRPARRALYDLASKIILNSKIIHSTESSYA
ncbi:MAG: DUF2064 domain-containing protein [Pseudohongiella sp.]|nr:DUF2064 domain-containing protein [Pseudohongiella sp.]